MGKITRGYLTAWLLSCLIAVTVCVEADAAEKTVDIEKSGRQIEQVYMNKPEITVYGSGLDGLDGSLAEGYLGAEKLEWVSSVPFVESKEGIYYYILLDISGSIPDAYFNSVKDGILDLRKGLGTEDQLILCTLGEDVKLLMDGTQSVEEMEAVLGTLENKDQKTLLFEAIDRVADLAAKVEPAQCKRKVLVVISDGEDIAVGQKMSQEALATLKEKGVPAYAMCISDTDRANINGFGEFARMSGGDIRIFQAKEGKAILTDLNTRLYGFTKISMKSGTNIVSNKNETFSLRFPVDHETLTKEVMDLRWIPDTTAPQIIKCEQSGERQIRLVFSEPVAGIETASSYLLKKDGNPVAISGVAYEKGVDSSVILTLEGILDNGNYEVTCTNVIDQSMEKNPVNDVFGMELSGIVVADTEPVKAEPDYTGVIFLVFLAVLVLILVIVLYNRGRKNGKEVLYVEGTPVFTSETEVRQHVAVQQKAKKTLEVTVSMSGKYPEKMQWQIDKSMIIGRTDICDVYFDDQKMSRQHFALEWKDGNLYITDLETTNGTMVNGIRLNCKRKLEAGDVVTAGSMEIMIGW